MVMKLELVFDKDIYNKQMDLLFDLSWKSKFAYYKNSQYLGAFLIVLGIALIYNRSTIFGIGYGCLFFGLSNFVPFIYYYFKLKSVYKKFDDAKVKEIESFKDVQKIFLEFSEKSLIEHIQDNLKIIDWTEFLIYMVKEDNLIMITKDYQPWILGEEEVGQENFKNIIAFVAQKIDLKKA